MAESRGRRMVKLVLKNQTSFKSFKKCNNSSSASEPKEIIEDAVSVSSATATFTETHTAAYHDRPTISSRPVIEIQKCTNEPKNPDVSEENVLIEETLKDDKILETGEQLLSKSDKKSDRRKNRVRTKDYCFYCEEEVGQFARHIVRNHPHEMEVQKIQALPKIKGQNERKILIAALRKKGNYLKSSIGPIKPVRKDQSTASPSKVAPCTFCLGFYARKQLWRHRKTCTERPDNARKTFALRDAQNLVVGSMCGDATLRNKVFPRMMADNISLVCKKDQLICLYGSRFVKTHREKHQITVTSRKMRELGRLLIEIKKIDKETDNLLQALKPSKFNVIVEATKAASGYDSEKDKFSAPTYAMNICTSLKECCDIGISHIYKTRNMANKEKVDEVKNEIETMKTLLINDWKFEISHQAANNLSENKMNTVTIIPLASDLKKFKEYLVREGETAATEIKKHPHDPKYFNILTEIVYCRTILLCRKRGGELSRLYVKQYEEATNNGGGYEEFKDALSQTEIILSKRFKRIVIKGKRKQTPVLFGTDVQRHIEELLMVRNNFVPDSNPFIFCSSTSSNPIIGYKVLAKHAKSASLKNPSAITTRRLRKHLATISQILSMNDTEIEQLSTFMGHSALTHRKEYRLPDEVYQTAKISKALMMMEDGRAGKHKGMSFENIEVDMEEELLTPDKPDSDEEENVYEDILDLSEYQSVMPRAGPSNQPKLAKVQKQRRILTPWTNQQKSVVLNYFKNHISQKRPPKKNECEELISQHSEILANKHWLKIKVFVQNTYTKKVTY